MPSAFHPPEQVAREEIVRASEEVMAWPDIPFSETETILRIDAADMEWDIGAMLYEPDTEIPVGADGRKVGVFLTHGGASDWRSMEPLARLLAGKLGYRIASMTYPGRLYLPDPSRDWPGDTSGTTAPCARRSGSTASGSPMTSTKSCTTPPCGRGTESAPTPAPPGHEVP